MSKHVLITTPIFPPEIGGPASYVPTMVEKLLPKRKVSVVCFSKNPKKISTKNYPVVAIHTKSSFLARQYRFFKAVEKSTTSFSTLFAQGTLTVGLATVLAANKTNRPMVLKFVGDEVWETFQRNHKSEFTLEEYYNKSAKSFTEKLMIETHRQILRAAKKIVTPSQYLKDFLVEYHKVNQHHIEVIANPVEIETPSTAKKKNQLVVVGRLVRWKRIDVVIEAFVEAKKAGSKYQLVIVGDGPEKRSLQKLIEKHEAANYILLKGALSKTETHKTIASSKALILWSTYEGQSHVLIESMMLGTSVIASDITPNRELLQHKRGHLLESKEQLVETILKDTFISPPTKAVVTEHSWSEHIKGLLEVL